MWTRGERGAALRARGDEFRAAGADRILLSPCWTGTPSSVGAWGGLPEEALREKARLLGGRAVGGGVIPFLGAGVSAGAGLPSWTGLISDLTDSVRLDGPAREEFDRLRVLDQAHVVGALLPAGTTLGEEVARRTRGSGHHASTPALLASLPGREATGVKEHPPGEEA